MTAMPAGRYRTALGVGWVVLAAAALIYARVASVPAQIALPLAAAFLVEFAFYVLPAFPDLWRSWVVSLGRLPAIGLLAISSVLPYLIYTIPAGVFDGRNLTLLAAIALVVVLVYARGQVNAARDALFVVLIAAFVLYRFFDRIYPPPMPKLQVSVLGHLMLIRTAALSIFGLRGGVKVRFWFFPTLPEWLAGLKWFSIAVAPLAVAGWATASIHLRDHALNPLTAVATFFGILWVVALSEEFFFRGLIQQWLENGTNAAIALIAASILFGSVHLGFHGLFPNWRFSIVAAVLGIFCGLAYRENRSIQTSMVTHALAATVFRVFFQ
jgi:membrane protease YdiL (CAAX protease family)